MPSCDAASWASFRCGAKSASRICVEHRVIGPLRRRHAHAERDPPRDLAHDRLDAAERIEVGPRQLGPRQPCCRSRCRSRRPTATRSPRTRYRRRSAGCSPGGGRRRGRRTSASPASMQRSQLRETARVDLAERLDRAHRLLLSHQWIVWQDTGRSRTAVSRFAGARLAARPRCRGCREPPRGVEPLRPGSKPGALPLSYGGMKVGRAPVRGQGQRSPEPAPPLAHRLKRSPRRRTASCSSDSPPSPFSWSESRCGRRESNPHGLSTAGF